MRGNLDWHTASLAGREVWLRELGADALSLAVWPAREPSAWEWEVLASSADAYIRGDVALSRASAMRASESAASALGLL